MKPACLISARAPRSTVAGRHGPRPYCRGGAVRGRVVKTLFCLGKVVEDGNSLAGGDEELAGAGVGRQSIERPACRPHGKGRQHPLTVHQVA